MTITTRSAVFLTMACLSAAGLWLTSAMAEGSKVGSSTDTPGRGDLAGFVATPQTEAGGNRAFLIAPNGLWFLATSPDAPGARLIDLNSGITLRFLTKPGLKIAGLSIAPDSKTVFAQDDEGQTVAWDAATGQLIANAAASVIHDVTRLSFGYDDNDAEIRAPADLLSRYHLHAHFPELKKSDDITINPSQDYAIVGQLGDPEWTNFQIWNLKQEKTEVFFRLEDDHCGYRPFAFDYDGKHLVFGNSRGESETKHLDFVSFEIHPNGPETGPAKATPHLGEKCNVPYSGIDEPEYALSPDARFITRGGGMPGSPEWAAWDLRSGRKVASIRPDGYGIVSTDGDTFAVIHDLQRDGARSKQLMTVLHNGRRKTFEIPRNSQTDHWRPLVLSADGKWIASRAGAVVTVWDSDSGKTVREYQVGKDRFGEVLRVSNSGDPLLINDHDGTAFVNGKWQLVHSDGDSLIVPLTSDFHSQCGVLFCDRAVAELGVVERKRIDRRAQEVRREDLSSDGRFVIVRAGYSKRGISKGADVLDVTDGHVMIHIYEDRRHFTSDGRSIVARDDAGSFVLYDLATGKRAWTAIPNPLQDGFHMILADGHVRFSPTKYPNFWLVRGFDVRPFGAAAAKAFVAPPDR